MARSSSGLGRLVLNQQITGSNPVRATKIRPSWPRTGRRFDLIRDSIPFGGTIGGKMERWYNSTV